MNCDSYFEIGSAHLVCQDYALCGSYKDMFYGIVSDGCSSAEYSELGAQILCHTTRYFLALYYDLFYNFINIESLASLLGNSIRTRADEIRKIYPISKDSLQATLLIAAMVNGRGFVFAWGDGVIIKSSETFKSAVYEIDYPLNNAPVYLMTDVEAYIKKFGPDQLSKNMKQYFIVFSPEKACQILNSDVSSQPYNKPYFNTFPIKSGDFITIATDGLSQYLDQNKKPIDIVKIIPQILDYPNYNGQFLKRTMNFMKRDIANKFWSHGDDIGIATLIN